MEESARVGVKVQGRCGKAQGGCGCVCVCVPECKRGTERVGMWSNIQGQEKDMARVCKSGPLRARESVLRCAGAWRGHSKSQGGCARMNEDVREAQGSWRVCRSAGMAGVAQAQKGWERVCGWGRLILVTCDLPCWFPIDFLEKPLGKVANSDPAIEVCCNCNSN